MPSLVGWLWGIRKRIGCSFSSVLTVLSATVFKGRVSEVYSYWLQTCFELIWIFSTSFFIYWENWFYAKVSSQVSHVIPNVSYYYSKSSLGSENVTPDFEFLNTYKIPPTPIPPRAPPPPPKKKMMMMYYNLTYAETSLWNCFWNVLRF